MDRLWATLPLGRIRGRCVAAMPVLPLRLLLMLLLVVAEPRFEVGGATPEAAGPLLPPVQSKAACTSLPLAPLAGLPWCRHPSALLPPLLPWLPL